MMIQNNLAEGISKYGLAVNFHGDELHYNNSAELGYELIQKWEIKMW